MVSTDAAPLTRSAPQQAQPSAYAHQTAVAPAVPPRAATYQPPQQAQTSLYGTTSLPYGTSAQPSGVYGGVTRSTPSTGVISVYGTSAPPMASGSSFAGGLANRAPVVRTAAASPPVPIAALNPYTGKWSTKARITSKSEMRSWNNAKGQGNLFSVDLVDAEGTEIKGTFFKAECDKFFPMLEEGKTYIFSCGKIGPVKNPRFSTLKNPYEITFDQNTQIEICADDSDIQGPKFSFVKLAEIANAALEAHVDVIAILRSVGDVQELVSKASGKPLKKRDLVFTDDSGYDIRFTVWGDKAVGLALNPIDTPIVAIKGARVGDYQGRTLASTNSTLIIPNPDIPEGHALYGWKAQFGDSLPSAMSMSSGGGDRSTPEDITKRKPLIAILEESLGLGDKPDYISCTAAVTYIKHDQDEGPWYTACPTEGCNKKVIQGMGDVWQCLKCNRDYAECRRRYIVNMSIADHSTTQWITVFDDDAKALLGGFTAEDLHQKKLNGDDAGFEQVFSDALFKDFNFKLRVKQEMVNDEPRLKVQVTTLAAVDFVKESQQLLLAIGKYD